jgi:hypothetical protein
MQRKCDACWLPPQSLPSLLACVYVYAGDYVCVCVRVLCQGVEGGGKDMVDLANPSFALRRVASRSSPLPLSPLLAFDRPFSALLPQKSASKQSIINAHSDSNVKSMGGFASASW